MSDMQIETEVAGRRSYRKWTDDEIATLRRLADLGVQSLAVALNRPKVAVYNKAKSLGIDVTKKRESADNI